MTEKTYQFGDQKYVQRPLVLGQVRQLIAELDGVPLDLRAGAAGIVRAVGDRLHLCLAIVLTPEGQSPRRKDLPAVADELDWSLTPEEIVGVVEDFFDCNPVASVLEKLTGAAEKATGKLSASLALGSRTSSSPSPEETSPEETGSSGGSPPPSADPGSGTGSGSSSSERPS